MVKVAADICFYTHLIHQPHYLTMTLALLSWTSSTVMIDDMLFFM